MKDNSAQASKKIALWHQLPKYIRRYIKDARKAGKLRVEVKATPERPITPEDQETLWRLGYDARVSKAMPNDFILVWETPFR